MEHTQPWLLTKTQEHQKLLSIIQEGGGAKNIAKMKQMGKMTARERIAYLIDTGSFFMEIGSFCAFDMYAQEGGCPAAGTVAGIGYVSGQQCIIVANDATVKAGSWFPMTVKKNLRMQEIAMDNHLPIIYLLDSAGVFLNMQDEIFPDKEHFGRVFRNNAKMSAMGITQIAVVLGPCVAGGSYLPIMSDEVLMVTGKGSICLAGPFLVKAAIGEDIDIETLAGAHTHNAISGIADYQFNTEQECFDRVKKIMGSLSSPHKQVCFSRTNSYPPIDHAHEKIYKIMQPDNIMPYNMVDLLTCIVDKGELDEFKKEYGKSIICGYARIDGWAVGIVANQRINTKKNQGEIQMGGVIYNDSADKAARFILNCNQKNIPLIFFQDVTGFMVGSKSEHAGIAKDGAKMINAVANSVVPKFTIIVGNSYGAGNYAMCGKAYDPRLIFAWPSAKIAVMGGVQAAKTLLQIQAGKASEQAPTEDAKKQILQDITNQYEKKSTAIYAAAHLWIDEIIDPKETRRYISEGIAMANHHPTTEKMRLGVFQV
ncbi:MAG: acyl-CoA carboxylase subunit beta [Phycisphaerales bacterium]|nr:acyl-CoA carboxylase subunit beta [Phycisphaerales bacterium]